MARHRRLRQEAQEKPELPHPATDVSLPDFPEEAVQANEDSNRFTLSAPQCGHGGDGSSERKTRVSKHVLQQEHTYSYIGMVILKTRF